MENFSFHWSIGYRNVFDTEVNRCKIDGLISPEFEYAYETTPDKAVITCGVGEFELRSEGDAIEAARVICAAPRREQQARF